MLRVFSGASSIDDPYLREAWSLAARARGRTAPNPHVGCVIVSGDRVVGRGWHARAGESHAEVVALADAGESACGATAYVTLEPCAHVGKTPACTSALIAAGVARVVIGMRDPNPEAAGGALVLRDAGIEIEFAADPTAFESLNAGWLTRLRTGMPRVIVKVATSLDGGIAMSDHGRTSITGASGRRVTAALRSSCDAVLVGMATAAIDDPSLRADANGDDLSQPFPYVLVGREWPAVLPSILMGERRCAVLVPYHASSAVEKGVASLSPSVEVCRYDDDHGIGGALASLGARGHSDLLVEPGQRLFDALWRDELIDTLVCVVAGGVMGKCSMGLSGLGGDMEGAALVPRMHAFDAEVYEGLSITYWRRADVRVSQG